MPVNFSRTDLESTHTMSADAVLAITLVTCQKKSTNWKEKSSEKGL